MTLSELERILLLHFFKNLQRQRREERKENRQIMKKRRANYEKKYHSYSSDSDEDLLLFQTPSPRRKRLEKRKKETELDATNRPASCNGNQSDVHTSTADADAVVSAKSTEDYAAELEQQATRHQDEINALKRRHRLQLDKMRMEHTRLQRLIAKKIGGFLGNKVKK